MSTYIAIARYGGYTSTYEVEAGVWADAVAKIQSHFSEYVRGATGTAPPMRACIDVREQCTASVIRIF